jgi:hypothetical protein
VRRTLVHGLSPMLEALTGAARSTRDPGMQRDEPPLQPRTWGPNLSMWTPESRGRTAKIRTKLKRYPTDLSDEEWSVIAPLFPPPSKKGRPRKTDLREVVNAIRYLVRTGCGWESCPAISRPSRRCTGGSGASFGDCCSRPSTTSR